MGLEISHNAPVHIGYLIPLFAYVAKTDKKLVFYVQKTRVENSNKPNAEQSTI